MKEKERIISYINDQIDCKTVDLHTTQANIELWEERVALYRDREKVLTEQLEELKTLTVHGEDDDS